MTVTAAPAPGSSTYQGARRGRSAAEASRSAFTALLQRDLAVLRKNLGEFVGRTVVQPFLLVFVFLYVFPKIGQGIGSGRGAAGQAQFATALVAGVVGLSIFFQGCRRWPSSWPPSSATPGRSKTASSLPCRCGWWRWGR